MANKLLLKSNGTEPILILTSRFRWMSVRKKDTGYFTPEQQKFIEKINKINEISVYSPLLQIKLLLITSPFLTKTEKTDTRNVESIEKIKLLLKIGADVRYLKNKTRERLVLFQNELFVSSSDNIANPVSKGWYYHGENGNFLIESYRTKFFYFFEKAKKLKLNKGGELCYFDTATTRLVCFFKDNIKEIIFLMLGALLGVILN